MDYHSLFHIDGIATKALKNIFAHLGISIRTLEQAHLFAQEQLLRTGEQWEEQPVKPIHRIIRRNHKQLMLDLKTLGFFDGVPPKQKTYTYGLILGSLKEDVIERLAYVADLYLQGYLFEHLVLVGSERSLLANEKKNLPENVTTEAQMLTYLSNQHPVLKGKKIIGINAPISIKEDGSLARATTDSSLTYFPQIAPEHGSCLVISNNPYILRQTLVAKRILNQKHYPTEGVGPAYRENSLDCIMLLDEFARALYEQYHLFFIQVK